MGNAININAGDSDYWNIPRDPESRPSPWQAKLGDVLSVAFMTVPGTHDSIARCGVLHAWCQSLSLNTQLEIGIRFFDIRCRHFNDSLPIHHGPFYQDQSFSGCLREMIDFLDRNPSEVLLVRVKEEYQAVDNTRSFSNTVLATISSFPEDKFWLLDYMPNVGQVRGEIIILRDFNIQDGNGYHFGYPYYNIDPRNIADKWECNEGDEKLESVERNLHRANTSLHPDPFVTYNSCSALISPRENARSMNPRLHSYIRNKLLNKSLHRLGIVVMDYPGPGIVMDIINSNFGGLPSS